MLLHRQLHLELSADLSRQCNGVVQVDAQPRLLFSIVARDPATGRSAEYGRNTCRPGYAFDTHSDLCARPARYQMFLIEGVKAPAEMPAPSHIDRALPVKRVQHHEPPIACNNLSCMAYDGRRPRKSVVRQDEGSVALECLQDRICVRQRPPSTIDDQTLAYGGKAIHRRQVVPRRTGLRKRNGVRRIPVAAGIHESLSSAMDPRKAGEIAVTVRR